MTSYVLNPNKRLLDVLDHVSHITSTSCSNMHSHLLKHVFSYLAMLLSTLVLAPLSLLYYARFKGHIIRAEKVTPLSIQKLSYSHATSLLAIMLGNLEFRPHFPTKAEPYFCTMIINNLEYKDSQCHCSMGFLEVTFWFFPVLFRVSCEPWVYSKVDDFRLRVFESSIEPWWVVRLRNNVVSTFLHGETVRLHDLNSKIYLNGIWGITATKGNSVTDEVEKPGMAPEQGLDEIRVRAGIEQWQIANAQERMYTFGDLNVEVRRSWVEDRGSLVMIAKDCRWTKLPTAALREGSYRRSSWVWQVLVALVSVPWELLAIYRNPLAATDLHIIRTDITYDTFRLRDAEMLKQTAIKLKLSYDNQRRAGTWSGAAMDAFFTNLIHGFSPAIKKRDEEEEMFEQRPERFPLDIEETIDEQWMSNTRTGESIGVVEKRVEYEDVPRAVN